MRVISGKCKGRRLKGEADKRVRPTSDKVKAAIFNILPDDFSTSAVLDLFAGTGGLGIEALSRGAQLAVFVDSSRQAFNTIKDNLKLCRMMDQGQVLTKKVSPALKLIAEKGSLFDLVFMDPPYEKSLAGPALELLGRLSLLGPDAIVVVEHSDKEPLQDAYGELVLKDKRNYGSTWVSFYQLEQPDE